MCIIIVKEIVGFVIYYLSLKIHFFFVLFNFDLIISNKESKFEYYIINCKHKHNK